MERAVEERVPHVEDMSMKMEQRKSKKKLRWNFLELKLDPFISLVID